MKTHLFPILLLMAGCYVASAQTERYVTITASNGSSNQVSIVEGETAEAVSFFGYDSGATFKKDGLTFTDGFFNFRSLKPSIVVKGPATFNLVTDSEGQKSLLSLKIKPESYPPDKTLILPPGTNQFFVTLESSTNLVHWSSATNGIYGSPDEARFFRIHMQKLN